MDEIKIGDRFIPLENSRKYGPKDWRLEVIDGIRTWTECEMSEEDRDFARMEDALAWDGHSTWCRTPPITQEAIDKYNLPPESLDGFAVFPAPMIYPTGKGPAAESQRLCTEALWMEHYAAMEKSQTVIALDAKPEDSDGTGLYFSDLKRGD